jgi:hypothetical protein
MSTIASIDFETGDFSQCAGHSAGCAIVSSPVFAGAFAAQFPPANNIEMLSGQSLPVASQRVWIQINALPTGGDPRVYSVLLFWNGTDGAGRVHIDSAGHLAVEGNPALTGTTTGTYTLAINTWYELSAAYDVAAGGIFKVWIRSFSQWRISMTPILDISVTHASASANLTILRSGSDIATCGTNLYDDAIVVTDTLQPNWSTGASFNLVRP